MCSIPWSSRAMVGSAVATIVWSRPARSMPSMIPLRMTRISRWVKVPAAASRGRVSLGREPGSDIDVLWRCCPRTYAPRILRQRVLCEAHPSHWIMPRWRTSFHHTDHNALDGVGLHVEEGEGNARRGRANFVNRLGGAPIRPSARVHKSERKTRGGTLVNKNRSKNYPQLGKVLT